MKTYQLKEPAVRASKITGLSYTLEDGTSKPDPEAGPAAGDYYVVAADGTGSVIAAADFEARYDEVPDGPLA